MQQAEPAAGGIDVPVGFIGAGNMTSAILGGAVAKGALRGPVAVVDPDPARRGSFATAFGNCSELIQWMESMEAGAGSQRCGLLVLAIKPQPLGALEAELRSAGLPIGERLVVTILAGTSAARVRAAVGGAARVVRVMPNTPCQVGEGMSAIAPGEGATAGDVDLTEALFAAVGRTVRLDEAMIDAFTAVAGSGPAYVFLLVEAMAAAGVSLGLAADQAERLARQVVLGSGVLMDRSGEPASELRRRVTSPGGATAEAIRVFESRWFGEIVREAMAACRDRARELGR